MRRWMRKADVLDIRIKTMNDELSCRPSAKILAVTCPVSDTSFGNAEGLIEFAGRLCYDSVSKFGNDSNWIEKRIRQGHESILEHASASFLITCSRAVSHELVRHRLASFSQRSQRYVKEDHFEYYIPKEIESLYPFRDYEELIHAIQIVYDDLLKRGLKKEIARYVLPNACMTELVMTMNFRELRHFINMRNNNKAMSEMRDIANQVFKICCSIAPNVFEDIKSNKEDI